MITFFNKYYENDNNGMQFVALICKSNPMACAGNDYKIFLNAKHELTIDGLSVWNEIYWKLNDSVNVIKEMIDVRYEFKVLVGRRWKDSLKLCKLILTKNNLYLSFF